MTLERQSVTPETRHVEGRENGHRSLSGNVGGAPAANGHRARGRGRIMIYSHDTFGLGHLRRSLLIADRVAGWQERPDIVIATGSPRPEGFSFPPGCDYLKLPAVMKDPNGSYRPRTLGAPLQDVVQLRSELLRTLALGFRPDVILVDHAPVGVEGELWPLFHELPRMKKRPRVVVGLRDIIDEADRVRGEWDRLHTWDLLDEVADRIIVYGDPKILTTAEELGLPRLFPKKLRFVGYLGRPRLMTTPPHGSNGSPMILVTPGGGGDGQEVLRSYANFLEHLPTRAQFGSVVVTGPLMSERRRHELLGRFRSLRQPVEVLTFVDGLDALLPRAAGVFAMAGYNTVTELLSARVPALLMPRVSPRREQLIRAERLARVADLEVCLPGRPNIDRISRFVDRVVAGGPTEESDVSLDGVERTAAELSALLSLHG